MSPSRVGDDLPLALLDRHWLGETSPAEAARVEAWFETHPDARTVYAQLRTTLKTDQVSLYTPEEWAHRRAVVFAFSLQRGVAQADTVDSHEAVLTPNASQTQAEAGRFRNWGRILTFPQSSQATAKVAGPATVKKLFRAWPPTRLIPHAFLRTAGLGMAVGAAILAIGLAWFSMRQHWMDRRPSPGSVIPVREVATKRGERATLDLADGTRVILGPQSRLRISPTYATGTGLGARDVELDGEAYFEVRHDTARPFRVGTAVGIAEDLGTAFVVTAYPEMRGMRVVVGSGEVTIAGRRSPAAPGIRRSRPLALLHRGDLARLDSMGTVSVWRGVDAPRYIAWTSGQLVFEDTPLPEATAALMRWYDVEIRLGDSSLASRALTVTVDGEPVQNVIRLLELLLNVRAEWQGRIVTLHPRPGTSAAHYNTAPPHGGIGIR